MADFSNVTIGSLGERPITMNDLIYELKIDFSQEVVDHMVDNLLIRSSAEELGVSVSDDELQAAADRFRIDEGLLSASETNEWLEENGLSLDELERKVEDDLLKSKMEKAVASEEKMNKLFAENIIQFEKAKIAEIVVHDQGLAAEIRAQLDEGEAEFGELASRYSLDSDSAVKGGFVGAVNRNDLPDPVAVAVFADDAAAVIGPVEADGDYYLVKLIEAKKADPADEQTRRLIIDQLFEEFIAERSESSGLKLDLF